MSGDAVKSFPSNWSRHAATAVKALGIMVALLGTGFSTAKDANSDLVQGWGENAQVIAIMGMLTTAGGVIFSAVNGEKAKSAYEAAKNSPPLDADDNPNIPKTAAALQQLATEAGKHAFVSDMAGVLAKHFPTGGSTKDNLEWPPKDSQEGSHA